MAKLNNLKKVELLENTVLEGDIGRVKEVYAQQTPFEITARALGLACRFVGADMVKCLIELGADFAYEFKSTMFSKYNCRLQLSNSCSVPVNYSRYVLCAAPEWNDAEKNRFSSIALLPAEARAQIALILLENSEKIHFNASELLYYAALNADMDVFYTLKSADVNISDYRKELLDGTLKYNRLTTEGRFDLEEIAGVLKQKQDDAFSRRLKMLIECMDSRKIMLSDTAFRFMDYAVWKQIFFTRWCSTDIFLSAVQHTNLTERAKKQEILSALIDCGNAEGLSYVLHEGWLKTEDEFKALFELAQQKEASAEIMACVLQYHNPAAHADKEAADDLSLEVKPLSAADIKKLWSSKKQEDGTLILTAYKGTEDYIVVPDMIGKTRVTALGEDIFSPNAAHLSDQQIEARKNIRCVEIPASIKKLPAGLLSMGKREALEEVILSEGLDEIGKNAFYNCTGLKEITLPQSLKIIGANAFFNCQSLEKIIVPEGVEKIASGAFGYCASLKEITLPSSLTELPGDLFANCPSLGSVDLPEGVCELPNSIFSRCSFSEYTVRENIKRIGAHAFSNCENLKKITLNDGLESIGSFALSACPIEEIVIPDSVREIGSYAFENCTQLRSVVLPKDVVIGEQAFAGCTCLKDGQGAIVINGVLQSFEGDESAALRLSDEVKTVTPRVLCTLPRIVYRPAEEESSIPDVSSLNVGDEVVFGRFPQDDTLRMKPLVWQVIAQQGNRRLLITKDSIIGLSDGGGLEYRKTWAESPLRGWLNSVFIETVFTEEERAHIPEVLLTNPNNRKTSPVTKGGEDTLDRVFLLSYDELMQYLPEDKQQRAKVTPYAREQWTSKRNTHFYYLRTPGTWGPVCVSNYLGGCVMTGNHVGVGTLRPAVWVE